ncbi:MAG: proline racemase family protein [Bacteroidota bacterium]
MSIWQKISQAENWSCPDNWQKVQTIDLHTEGEPLRVILSGFPALTGGTILSYRAYVAEHWDHLRKALMWEPRGHADMYGCILSPPVSETADFGTFFLHNEGYSTMCGHAIIALATLVVKMGWVALSSPSVNVKIDTPAGLVEANVLQQAGKIKKVSFVNVASYVYALDQSVEIAGLGTVKYDLAFGGAYYAYVDATALGLSLAADNNAEIIRLGKAIKQAVMASTHIQHPDPDAQALGFLYGTIFIGPAENEANHSRNVCVFAEGEVDRSPTGTGVSGRLALHHARNQIQIQEEISIESILGTSFSCQVIRETHYFGRPAIIPQVAGTAYITGRHEFLLDPEDPLGEGFLLR